MHLNAKWEPSFTHVRLGNSSGQSKVGASKNLARQKYWRVRRIDNFGASKYLARMVRQDFWRVDIFGTSKFLARMARQDFWRVDIFGASKFVAHKARRNLWRVKSCGTYGVKHFGACGAYGALTRRRLAPHLVHSFCIASATVE